MDAVFSNLVEILKKEGEGIGWLIVLCQQQDEGRQVNMLVGAENVTIESMVAPIVSALNDIPSEDERQSLLEYVISLIMDGTMVSGVSSKGGIVVPGSNNVC